MIDPKKTFLHSPPNTFRITDIWLFISKDDKGNEGVCAFSTPDGVLMPMIAADAARLDSLRRRAKELAALESDTGKKIRLIRMTQREEVEVIEP